MNRRAAVLELLELAAGVALVMFAPVPVVALVRWLAGF